MLEWQTLGLHNAQGLWLCLAGGNAENGWFCVSGSPDEQKTAKTAFRGAPTSRKQQKQTIRGLGWAENHYDTEIFTEGTDFRTSYYGGCNRALSGRDETNLVYADGVDKFFFLPSLGLYYSGKLNIKSGGCYWSSTAHPNHDDVAYIFRFGSSSIDLTYYYTRDRGARAQPFSFFGDN